ncbi:hypothetical protein SteCoe_4489 [Stentor coeruleus]|uniref:Guanylate cyclase domain-containing protein n=1 Tax=Stentor coeruleus TaxID=5963 RepID=A0A1R2CUN3_9CILI|nr:hypothetical protein SteCoe_4489 [Stentor coeruleus]
MLFVTIFALFGDDFRLAVFTKSADDGFSASMIVCLILFCFEIILAFITKPEYRFSFFFWLDVLSTVSLIFDINWIWNLIQSKASSTLVQSTQIARASRASRAGTRAARIIRVIRVIRLIRIVKLYKLAQARLKKNKASLVRSDVTCRGTAEIHPMNLTKNIAESEQIPEDSISQDFESFGDYKPENENQIKESSTINRKMTSYRRSITVGDKKFDLPQESKVGKKLSELTTMRVIIVVLIMILILPFFNINMYREIDSYVMGLDLIDKFIDDQSKFNFFFNEYIEQHKKDSLPLIYLEVTNKLKWNSSINPDNLRDVEVNIITLDAEDTYEYFSFAIYDLSSQTSMQAGINMIKTFFICLVLTIGSVMFSKDTNEIVLEPLENMIRTVKNISKNPLKAVQEEEQNAVIREEAFEKSDDKNCKKNMILETEILEMLIIKIGALMALGFGEAGSEIIAKNMQQSKGDVDPLMPGKQQLCIFGFTDIRQFPDVTEVLEQDIMIYVNEIALIVHNSVDECLGTTNRNLGDIFLLVWKFPDSVISKDKYKAKTLIISHPYVAQYADLALISYIKIISEINRNKTILKYNENQSILKKLPNFKVKMGFGMHFGWGIEGTIGSEYKIDASYLSPHVNLASRLCAATKQYGVWMLISEYIHNLLSLKMRNLTRRVDRCTFKGSAEPMDIFTIDLNVDNLESYTPRIIDHEKNKKRARVAKRISRDELHKDLWSGVYKSVRKLKEENDLMQMVSDRSVKFYDAFEQALADYLNGQWEIAREGFVKALKLRENDGPCLNMINYIDEYGGVAPVTWPGYRKLLEK